MAKFFVFRKRVSFQRKQLRWVAVCFVHPTSLHWLKNTELCQDLLAVGLLVAGVAKGATRASQDPLKTRWLSWQHTLCEGQHGPGCIFLVWISIFLLQR